MNSGPVDPFALFSYAVAGIFLLAGVLIVLNVLWLFVKLIRWIFKKRPEAPVVPDRAAGEGEQGQP